MSTALRSSSRSSSVSVPRDPDVTAAINARRNRGVRSALPTTNDTTVVPTTTPDTTVAKVKTSSKAKARRSAAERGATANVPETDKVTKTKKVAKKAAPKAKAKAAPRPKLTGYDKRSDGTMSARDLPCLCGCGSPTVTKDARFISGHDAKMRQTILTSSEDATERAEAIPSIVQPFFANGEVIAGLRLRSDKIVDVKRVGSASAGSDEDDSEG